MNTTKRKAISTKNNISVCIKQDALQCYMQRTCVYRLRLPIYAFSFVYNWNFSFLFTFFILAKVMRQYFISFFFRSLSFSSYINCLVWQNEICFWQFQLPCPIEWVVKYCAVYRIHVLRQTIHYSNKKLPSIYLKMHKTHLFHILHSFSKHTNDRKIVKQKLLKNKI